MSKKPLLFGDKSFDAQKMEKMRSVEGRGWDWSYVPGYSEEKRENERRAATGQKPNPIPRLQWVRVSKTNGDDVDYRQNVTWRTLGYEACTKKDLEKYGWEMPPAGYEAPDGTIRREDLALAIVGSEQAERNRIEQKRFTADFAGRSAAASHIEDDERKQGTGSLEDALEATAS